ncbi:DUF2690 domain-containing protein [Streptomyces rubellomurinus]|uniref:HTH cro/C1-type domain-containing protein n=1 Tax=Streptomyces rubellomurinus (strain ATCC 31215) TaxID=359131 RepID=A0A0F2TH21_STRR3|nr:DUF2690 domain-containing protein [Streptomyces rubellomurinus]KJS62464.1 hypothetical protein VM95_08745 [Streptomyces rubellomurinus]
MGSAWKKLPEELSEPARALVDGLRAVKDSTGLSLSELAARTHYSRASWERWLNGKRIITEQALEALVGAVDCDAAALRELWRRAAEGPAELPAGEAADADAQAGADPETGADEPVVEAPAVEATEETAAEDVEPPEDAEDVEDAAEPAPAVRWWRRPAALIAGAALLAAVLVLTGLSLSRRGGPSEPVADPLPTVTFTAKAAQTIPATPDCRAVGCAHKDPKYTGCGKDARTLQTQVVGKVVVYLRYSRTCQAAWAAITEGEPKDYATITDSNGESETALIHYGYDNYSLMLNAADPALGFRVCGDQPAGHDCTGIVTDLASVVESTPIPIGPASPPPGTGAGAQPSTAAPSGTPSGSPSPSLSPSLSPSPAPGQ